MDTDMIAALLVCVAILIFSGGRLLRSPVAPEGKQTPSSVIASKPAPVDDRPAEVIALEKEIGAPISYESGRECYINYGYKVSLYDRRGYGDGFGFAWADSLDAAIIQARKTLKENEDRKKFEPEEKARKEQEKMNRAKWWDEHHKS